MNTLLRSALVIAVGAAVIVTGIAGAGTRASTTVTIQTENGDFWGYVDSSRPLRCAKDRKIVLFKQAGSEQDPSIDQKVGSDTASLQGDRYMWSTGNTGQFGKFYARAKRTADCKGDSSPTVRSRRP